MLFWGAATELPGFCRAARWIAARVHTRGHTCVHDQGRQEACTCHLCTAYTLVPRSTWEGSTLSPSWESWVPDDPASQAGMSSQPDGHTQWRLDFQRPLDPVFLSLPCPGFCAFISAFPGVYVCLWNFCPPPLFFSYQMTFYSSFKALCRCCLFQEATSDSTMVELVTP